MGGPKWRRSGEDPDYRFSLVLAVGLGLLAAVLSALAYFRWRGNEIAMRHNRRLPGTLAMSLVAAAVLVVAAAIAALMVIS